MLRRATRICGAYMLCVAAGACLPLGLLVPGFGIVGVAAGVGGVYVAVRVADAGPHLLGVASGLGIPVFLAGWFNRGWPPPCGAPEVTTACWGVDAQPFLIAGSILIAGGLVGFVAASVIGPRSTRA